MSIGTALPPRADDVLFTYDGAGHRVQRKQGQAVTQYLNDKASELVQLLAEVDGQGSVTARYCLGSMLVSQERAGADSYYHYDALGSCRALTNASETLTDTYSYDGFGNLTASTGSTPNPYQYVAAYGYYTDPDTGLLYLRARYYSPSIGRFVSMDSYLGSAADPGSLHRYLYCYGSPLARIDPSGHISEQTWVDICMAAGGLSLCLSLEAISVASLTTRAASVATLEAEATFFAGAAAIFFALGSSGIHWRGTSEPWAHGITGALGATAVLIAGAVKGTMELMRLPFSHVAASAVFAYCVFLCGVMLSIGWDA